MRTRTSSFWRLFAGVALVAVMGSAVGCRTTTADPGTGSYVAVDPPQVEGLNVTTISAKTTSAGVSPTVDFVAVEARIQEFLDLRRDVFLNQTEPAALTYIADEAVIDFVLAERAANDEIRDQGYMSTVEAMSTWPNIMAIETDGDRIRVTDCTERQEINAVNQFNLYFVEHRYWLTPDGDTWRVAEMETVHNGFLETDARFGCAPQSFIERAEAAAATMWSELITIARDPDGAPEPSAVFEAGLAAEYARSARTAAEHNIVLTSSEDVTFSAIGIDTRADLVRLRDDAGTTVVVEACRRFPDGLEIVDESTGEVVQSMGAGGEMAQLIYVNLATSPQGGSGVDQVFGLESAPGGCGATR